MLLDLGRDGTSSDESDEDNPGTFRRHVQPHLSQQCVEWKRRFDSVAMLQAPTTEPRRGVQPRTRTPSTVVSRRKKYQPGLPVNMYDPTWLAKNQAARNLRVADPYDFSFPAEVFGFAFLILIALRCIDPRLGHSEAIADKRRCVYICLVHVEVVHDHPFLRLAVTPFFRRNIKLLDIVLDNVTPRISENEVEDG